MCSSRSCRRRCRDNFRRVSRSGSCGTVHAFITSRHTARFERVHAIVMGGGMSSTRGRSRNHLRERIGEDRLGLAGRVMIRRVRRARWISTERLRQRVLVLGPRMRVRMRMRVSLDGREGVGERGRIPWRTQGIIFHPIAMYRMLRIGRNHLCSLASSVRAARCEGSDLRAELLHFLFQRMQIAAISARLK